LEKISAIYNQVYDWGLIGICISEPRCSGDAVYIVEQGGPEFSNVSFFEFQLSAGWVYGEGGADYSPAIGKEILVGNRTQSPDRLIVIAVLGNGTREIVLDTYLRP
jgi:hypothetical protein